MEKKRLYFIDYGKALGILFVLMIHSGIRPLNEYVLFAMPLFFIASGYTLNVQGRDLKQFAKDRFLKLLIPFWIFSLADILLETARAYFYRYGTYKIAIPALINMIYGSGFKVPDIFGIRELIVTNVPYVQPCVCQSSCSIYECYFACKLPSVVFTGNVYSKSSCVYHSKEL